MYNLYYEEQDIFFFFKIAYNYTRFIRADSKWYYIKEEKDDMGNYYPSHGMSMFYHLSVSDWLEIGEQIWDMSLKHNEKLLRKFK